MKNYIYKKTKASLLIISSFFILTWMPSQYAYAELESSVPENQHFNTVQTSEQNHNQETIVITVDPSEVEHSQPKLPKLRTSSAPLSRLTDVALKYGKTKIADNKYLELHGNYCRQARDGDTDAQYAIAWMYENGKGVAQDTIVAELFYRMAAEQEYQLAKESLARLGLDETRELDITKLPNCMQTEPEVADTSPTELYIYTDDNQEGVSMQRRPSASTTALFLSQKNILKIVNKLAPSFNIDSNLVMSFIAVESGFNVQATSPKNAQGLMQLIPATAARFGVKNPYKPEDNIKGGLAYLQYLLAYYKGNVHLVAAAYNAGEGAVDKYRGVPPYKETRMYVGKILSLYNKVRHPYRSDFIEASPILQVLDHLDTRSSKRNM